MPAIVDHEERRAALSALAAGIIARDGLDFATVRQIAQEAGYSTKVVSHYFPDKRSLLMATYRYAAEETSALAEATQRHGTDATQFAVSLLPIGKTMLGNWKVWLAFWSFAISDKDFAVEQRRQVRRARARLAELLTRDSHFGHLSAKAQKDAARTVLTRIMGIALQAVFDPQDWPRDRQIDSVKETIASLKASR